MPPTATAAWMPVPRAIFPIASVICRASSRVGLRMTQRMPRLRSLVEQQLNGRQYKREGLSGSGLGGGDEVAAGQCRLNGLAWMGVGAVKFCFTRLLIN